LIERLEIAPGYSICRVINGLWQLSRGHRSESVDRRAGVDLLLRLVDAGLTTFDCADIYLGVEEVLGSLLQRMRESGRDPHGVEIHTKYVPDRSSLATLERVDVAGAIEASLGRLGVERLDLVQLHWWDYDQPKLVDAAGWLVDLQSQGKIRHLGTTNFDRPHLERLLEAGIPIVTNQAQYSLLDRRVESSLSALCGEREVHLLGYGVLAGGFLSQRYRHATEPELPFENRSLVKYRLIIDEFGGWALYQHLLDALAEIARKHSTALATVAARWVLDRDHVAAVMIGTRSDAHIDDNLCLFELRLDTEDRERIDSVLADAQGPTGEPFELERLPEGRHAEIMWTDLNRQRETE